MQLKFFTCSIFDYITEEEQINKFLRSVKVLEMKRELVCEENRMYWVICVTFLNQSSSDSHERNKAGYKTDYKELLTEEQFKKFCNYRKIRKLIADDDAVPAFAVFTDYELSEFSKLEKITIDTIKQIKGVGQKKLEKYGNKFCELVVTVTYEEGE